MWQCCVRLCLIFDFIWWLIWWFMWFAFVFESCWGQKVDAWLDEGLVVGNGGLFWVCKGEGLQKMGKASQFFFSPGQILLWEDLAARLGLGDVGRAGRACGSMLELGEWRRWGESSERSHRAHCAHTITSRSHHLIVTFWLDLPASLHAFQFRPQVKVYCFSAKKSRWISKVKQTFLNIYCFGCCLILEFPLSNPGSVTVIREVSRFRDVLRVRMIDCNSPESTIGGERSCVTQPCRVSSIPSAPPFRCRRWGIFLAA